MRAKKWKKVVVRTHYYSHDFDCCGDYAAVTIWADATKVQEWGDWYHDKGREKAEGFVSALRMVLPDLVIKHESVADYDG